MKRRALLLAFVAFVSGLFLAVPASHAARILKVGIIDALSGGAAPMSIDNLNGFKMAINEVNAKGGVNGTKIEFVTRDNRFKTQCPSPWQKNWS